ncbi:hypothetical protein C0993_003053 [Termitomyces sp. T159_Od127]|nr:hypothetical protein C0993_003053 [Termitomyces sp. T159_Od127]
MLLYRFITRSLTRSRSRSRSRTGRDTPPPVDLNEPIPGLPPSHNGRAQLDSMGQSGPSKPVTRIPSRPLSSTTSVTNGTITPATPRAKKRPPSRIPVSKDSTPRPRTAKAPATCKKLHTIFGIPLSSPKKSTFTSPNQGSPGASLDRAPPLTRTDESEDSDPTPKAFTSHLFQPHPRAGSPTPTARPKLGHNSSNSSAGTSTSRSSRLQRYLNGGQKTPSPHSTDAVSAPIGRPSIFSPRRGNSPSNSPSNRSSPSSAPDTMLVKPKAAGSMRLPPMHPPRISHTSPPPQEELSGPGSKMKMASLGHFSRNNSIDSSSRGGAVDGLGNLNGHTRMKMVHSRRHSHRSTQHGSFDFERPGWSATMQRTVSGETTGSGMSSTGTTWGRGLDGHVGGIRESAMGPGLAGVGTLQRDMSLKRGKEREEMMARIKEEERRRRRVEIQDKGRTTAKEFGVLPSKSQTSDLPPRTSSPEDDRALATGKPSTLGRKHGTIFEKTKVTTLGASLGPFAFEPPVSPPTWGIATIANERDNRKDAPLAMTCSGDKSRDKPRKKACLESDKEKSLDREKERRVPNVYRGDRAPVPVPIPVPVTSASIGYRSGLKGRSLDLGLGLSWAPSSVREDALLPSSILMGRSTSGSSSLASMSRGKSVSRSASGNGKTEAVPVLASQVAKVFKSVLSDKGYQEFKQYVDRFDAHEIPFDGPTGIVTCVERLLVSAPGLSEENRRQLLDNFIYVVLQHG